MSGGGGATASTTASGGQSQTLFVRTATPPIAKRTHVTAGGGGDSSDAVGDDAHEGYHEQPLVLTSAAVQNGRDSVSLAGNAYSVYEQTLGSTGVAALMWIMCILAVLTMFVSFATLAYGHWFSGLYLFVLFAFVSLVLAAYAVMVHVHVKVDRAWSWFIFVLWVILLLGALVGAALVIVVFAAVASNCSGSGKGARIAYGNDDLVPHTRGFAWLSPGGIPSTTPRCNHFSGFSLYTPLVLACVYALASLCSLVIHIKFGSVQMEKRTWRPLGSSARAMAVAAPGDIDGDVDLDAAYDTAAASARTVAAQEPYSIDDVDPDDDLSGV